MTTFMLSKIESNIQTIIFPLISFSIYKMSADEIADAFISHFYPTLDSDCSQLADLYVSEL